MKHIRLVAIEDEYDTSPGLIIRGTPNIEGLMADREGGLIAHDLIEHQNGQSNIGYIADELEAMGGIWHARGRHGDMVSKYGHNHTPAQHVAADIARMAYEATYDPYYCPGQRRFTTRAHDHDDDFMESIDEARRLIRDNDETTVDEAYLADCLHYMRRGFRKAQRRFGSGYESHTLYRAIKNAVARAIRDVEFVGQEFVLSYGRGQASCREIYQ